MNERIGLEVGEMHEILDRIEAQGVSPDIQRNITAIRDRLHAMTPESRPYFSPNEEAARIELYEELLTLPNPKAIYFLEYTIGEAIEHLDHRTADGLALTRFYMATLQGRTLH